MGTPLARYVAWYDGLPAELRSYLAPHLFHPWLPGIDSDPPPALDGARVSRPRSGALGPRLARLVADPAREAELAAGLADRTDAVLADVSVREQWTGERALDGLGADTHDGPRRAIHHRAILRSMEWMRAVEQWSALREAALATPRIERWLQKRDTAP